jgi:hypothetical protein
MASAFLLFFDDVLLALASAGAAAGAVFAAGAAALVPAAGAAVASVFALFFEDFLLAVVALPEDLSAAVPDAAVSAAVADFFDFFDFVVVVEGVVVAVPEEEAWPAVELVWACAQPAITANARSRPNDTPQVNRAVLFFKGFFS